MCSKTIDEARRIMAICNACRYCEGFCAVFPAMELRRTFAEDDLTYLANLCHDCRGCYYACQYAPPHQFAVNVPETFARLRTETYRRYAWPGFLAGAFRRNGSVVAWITLVSVATVVVLTLALEESSVVFATHAGEGAFYAVIPYALMVVPASAIALYVVVAMALAAGRFWRQCGASGRAGWRALGRATGDAMRLRYLGGGGAEQGCNYPGAGFSNWRKWLHHLVVYGFLLDLASTTVAAMYHHLLHREAPYPLWSIPVVLGTVGGVALLIGTAGLLLLKWRSNEAPADRGGVGMDVGFLVSLHLTSLTGLLLLAFRETPAMGTLLAVHLGVVAGLFLTLPYGKFIHAIYRYAALVRYANEQARQNP